MKISGKFAIQNLVFFRELARDFLFFFALVHEKDAAMDESDIT